MQRRRSRSAAALLTIALLVAACGDDDEGDAATAAQRDDVTTIGMLLPAGSGDDTATSAAIEQAESELDVEVEALEPSSDGSDRVELLDLLASGDADLVIAMGGDVLEAVEDVAADHPQLPFAVIGGAEPSEPNVTAVQVRAEQAAYLAGAAAALSSPAKHLGFVGGVEDDATRAVQAGFTAGAMRIDRATKVDVAYLPTGSATDVAGATALATGQLSAGAEVVLGAPVGIDDAVFTAVAQHGPPARAIGVGSDRSEGLAPALQPVVLTWAVTRVGVALFAVVEAFVEGRLVSGVLELGLKEGAVGITTDGLPPDVVTQIDDLIEGLVAGEIPVPTTP